MGKLGRACYWCMGGAWLHGGGAWVWGQHCILPGWWGCWIGEVGPEHWGLVLDEVIYATPTVTTRAPMPCTTHARSSSPINQNPNPTPPNPGPVGLHHTAAGIQSMV